MTKRTVLLLLLLSSFLSGIDLQAAIPDGQLSEQIEPFGGQTCFRTEKRKGILSSDTAFEIVISEVFSATGKKWLLMKMFVPIGSRGAVPVVFHRRLDPHEEAATLEQEALGLMENRLRDFASIIPIYRSAQQFRPHPSS